MCGIASIFSYHRVAGPIDRDELRQMRDAMVARGPDGKGEWYSPNSRVGFAHRRLSIIDLSEQGAQPMESEDGKLVVSFNGEIYNYKALRTQLEAKSYRFQSNSDTEVLLHLYAEMGMEMLHELRGMFAFVLWDARQGKLFLARDPYGIKPLYYADDGWCIRAASQVKALLAGGKLSREHEPAGLAGFYLFGTVPEPWTLYRGIQALPAGHYLQVDDAGVSEPIGWCNVASIFVEASQTGLAFSKDDAVAEIHAALQESVKAHLVADVPVGLFLSSGIDSGALAGLVKDQNQPVEAVTLGFSEYVGTADDEVPLAQEIAQHYGVRHHVHRVGQQEFARHLPSILAAMDQPSTDGINTWLVSQAAAMQGWKVALSGVGGDELLGGYPSFHDIPHWVRRFAIPSMIPFLGTAFYKVASRLSAIASPHAPNSSLTNPKFAGMLKYGGTYAGAYLLRRGLFLPEELPTVMGEELAREGLRRLQPMAYLNQQLAGASQFAERAPPAMKVSALESSIYMRNQLLRDSDWAGMAHSLEIRTPLVDIDLLKKVAPLLTALRPGDGKHALASAPSQSLPEHIRNRPKTGFTVPVNQWLQQDKNLDAWKQIPALRQPSCPWARRWAYTVMAMNTGGL
ncbi:MAG: asparagine synthase (glutamine-hydrolyzing) [Sulfuricellaceae bacterium]|nr:asparagine synthase (glutamine-hydrolyzing) [Sulfuricellaceae bacterium]